MEYACPVMYFGILNKCSFHCKAGEGSDGANEVEISVRPFPIIVGPSSLLSPARGGNLRVKCSLVSR
jgi:hypothetical protein